MRSLEEHQAILIVLYEKSGMTLKEAITEMMYLSDNVKAMAQMIVWAYQNNPSKEEIYEKTEELLEEN